MTGAFVVAGLVLAAVAPARALAWRNGPIDTVPEWPKLVAPVPKGATDACAGIRIRHYERIEAQGFLGLATPSADGKTVERAVFYNIFLAWKAWELKQIEGRRDWRGYGDWYQRYLAAVPHEIRPRDPADFTFRLAELCAHLKKRKVTSLTYACSMDTATSDDGDDEDSKRPEESRTKRRSEKQEYSWIISECFLSTHPGKDPSFAELKRHMLGAPEKATDGTFNSPSDVMDLKRFRELQYLPLLRQAVHGAVVRFETGDRGGRTASGHPSSSGTDGLCRVNPTTPPWQPSQILAGAGLPQISFK